MCYGGGGKGAPPRREADAGAEGTGAGGGPAGGPRSPVLRPHGDPAYLPPGLGGLQAAGREGSRPGPDPWLASAGGRRVSPWLGRSMAEHPASVKATDG